MSKRKKFLITALIIIIAIVSIATIKHYAIGPRYVSETPLLAEMTIYYKGSEYRYVFGGNKIKSGKCIKYGLFEHMYLSENGDEYIIVSQLHERNVFIRSDLIKSDN